MAVLILRVSEDSWNLGDLLRAILWLGITMSFFFFSTGGYGSLRTRFILAGFLSTYELLLKGVASKVFFLALFGSVFSESEAGSLLIPIELSTSTVM